MDYEIKLSQQHIQVINDALMQMPYYLAAPVIGSINQQLNAENSAKPDAMMAESKQQEVSAGFPAKSSSLPPTS